MIAVEQIADLYESAVEESPENEDYLSHLFMAHVRLGGYKKQHQTAVRLHKLKPENHPYHYWSIMSLVMQVRGPIVVAVDFNAERVILSRVQR